jgi:RinA family phage transcriptional activator
MLYDYPYLKRERDEIRQAIIEAGGIPDFGGKVSGGAVSNPTESKVIRLDQNWRLKAIDLAVNGIEAAFNLMEPEQRQFVQAHYWRRDSTIVTVMQACNISRPTFYRWRRWVIQTVGYHLGLFEEAPRSIGAQRRLRQA